LKTPVIGLPGINTKSSAEEIEDVQKLARIFQLPYLEAVCTNLQSKEDFLNPSIGTFLNDEMGQRLKDLFLNRDRLADVVFIVEGKCGTMVCRVEGGLFCAQ